MLFKTEIRRGNPKFCRAAYAVIISDNTRVHVETFFGHDGRTTRALAAAYAKRIEARDSFPWPRQPYLPSNFPIK